MKENILIFGDSYSTFNGYVPEGYAIYYSEDGRPESDVTAVSETWWHQVAQEKEFNIVLNNSWSGSTIGYTAYGGRDCSEDSSFIYRLHKLIEDRFFEQNQIHKVFIFGGTNDSWSDAPLGTAKYENFKKEDLFFVLPAVCYFLKAAKETLPDAEIYCLVNTGLKPEISHTMKSACEKFDVTPVVFKHIDKNCGHPTIKGMTDIKNSVLEALKNK